MMLQIDAAWRSGDGAIAGRRADAMAASAIWLWRVEMRAGDVMTADVVSVGPDASVTDVAKLMLDRRISGVPVVDGAGNLLGILSEGDLIRRVELITRRRPWWVGPGASAEETAAAYVKAHGLKAGDVMTTGVVTIDEHQPLDEVAMLFEARGIKRAPVVRNGKMVGIVSRANLLQGLAASAAGGVGPDDAGIRSAIMETAAGEAGVRASLVDVTVANGVVHLWGNVASQAERDAVRVCAERAEGVRAVKDHLRVMPAAIVAAEPE
jgi:CBS domain-containing protein